MNDMLTPEDVADYFQIDIETVISWLERGDLAGLDFEGIWRVPMDEFVRFIHARTRETQLDVFSKNIQDSDRWAEFLENSPAVASDLEKSEYVENTFGAFLKNVLEDRKAGHSADNIVSFTKPSDD